MNLFEFAFYTGVGYFMGWCVFKILETSVKTIYNTIKYLLFNK